MGSSSTLIDGSVPEGKAVKPPRTHWDMLLERRSIEELEEILNERLSRAEEPPHRFLTSRDRPTYAHLRRPPTVGGVRRLSACSEAGRSAVPTPNSR